VGRTPECRIHEVTRTIDLRMCDIFPNHWIYIVVSPTLPTPGVKRKLHSQTHEFQSHEAMEAIDLGIYVYLSRPWDKSVLRGCWREFGISSSR
jgi:hypothetical protein